MPSIEILVQKLFVGIMPAQMVINLMVSKVSAEQ